MFSAIPKPAGLRGSGLVPNQAGRSATPSGSSAVPVDAGSDPGSMRGAGEADASGALPALIADGAPDSRQEVAERTSSEVKARARNLMLANLRAGGS